MRAISNRLRLHRTYCQHRTLHRSPTQTTAAPARCVRALADANDGDTIGFAVTGTIGLTSGELLVAKNITISGPGAENLAVNGNAKSTVFHIASGETVTISGLTITNGHASDSGGGIYNDHAVLILNDCIISGNSAAAISAVVSTMTEKTLVMQRCR